MPTSRPRVAVIGAGVSGIASAHVLEQRGFDVIVFEKSHSLGGVWAVAYPGVRLQNIAAHYHISDFAWPFKPDLHPTAKQILDYLNAAVTQMRIDVRLSHAVTAIEETTNGWSVEYENERGSRIEQFDYVVIAVGQYTDGKHRPAYPGESRFRGVVATEREVMTLEDFDGKRVIVVGFGKSAVDMATMAANRGARVTQVFREPRWLIPQRILGAHFTFALFNRFGSVMMTSWAHPTGAERLLHSRMRPVVHGFWRQIERVFASEIERRARSGNDASRARLECVRPRHSLLLDLRSACALAPDRYFEHVASGSIVPRRGELRGFDADGIVLNDGARMPADLVLLCVGSQTPSFPFLPPRYRSLLEAEPDGAQLYRHLVHPRIPRLGFAGFNHGFMHVPAVEVGAIWLAAVFRGELCLPSVDEMEHSVNRVRTWKRSNVRFEPSRLCAVSTRFQQYIDILLKDLGVSPYRKMPNVAAEVFARYAASDYRDVGRDYDRTRSRQMKVRRPIAVDS